MNSTNHRARQVALIIRGVARRAASVVAECNYAQRRLTQIRLSPDGYMNDSEHAPSTYGEFLLRTSGSVWREPSARDRAAGRPCRR
jgi:hypothetical protein